MTVPHFIGRPRETSDYLHDTKHTVKGVPPEDIQVKNSDFPTAMGATANNKRRRQP